MEAMPLKWHEFEYLPVALQDATTKQVLMIQYMTQEGLHRTLEERSTWLWSRSRETHWLAGSGGGGYDLLDLRANCMGDSLFALVDARGRAVCHLGNASCFSNGLAAGSTRD